LELKAIDDGKRHQQLSNQRKDRRKRGGKQKFVSKI
jgi:hypothetical protein